MFANTVIVGRKVGMITQNENNSWDGVNATRQSRSLTVLRSMRTAAHLQSLQDRRRAVCYIVYLQTRNQPARR
ncbi:MAG: hypothetical protein ABWY27_13160, partial [Telluria sp.]